MNNNKTFITLLITALSFCGVILYVATHRGTPVIDFEAYYTGATIVREGNVKKLYDVSTQKEARNKVIDRVPRNGLLAYRNPPLLAYLLAPLSNLDFDYAYVSFISLTLLSFCIFCYMLYKKGFLQSNSDILTLFLYLPVIHSIMIGQVAPILLLCVASSVFLIQKGRYRLAGFIMTSLLFKPQRFLLGLIFLLFVKNKSQYAQGLLIGFVMFAFLNVLIDPSLIYKMPQFLVATQNMSNGTDLADSYSIQSIVKFIFPAINDTENLKITIFVSILGLVSYTAYILKKGVKNIEEGIISAIPISLLLGVHTMPADYVLVALPLIMLKKWGERVVLLILICTPWLGFIKHTSWLIVVIHGAVLIAVLAKNTKIKARA